MNNFFIRRAKLADLKDIAANNQAMAKETENKQLHPATLEAGVKNLFENQKRGFYLLAEQDGRVVGQLMVTYEWSDWRNADFWWIQSVYVAPPARRQGVFRKLYQHLTELAKAQDRVCGLRLYTEQNNRSAQSVYTKLGMQPAKYSMYEIEWSEEH